ncbi:MAG: right-handed parallel beta-helix repeat-containing protein [Methanomicrobia archaeon]|nr:right-handed parallel beta-helix repeat-containing protein [Methanomicrobia archaeon]
MSKILKLMTLAIIVVIIGSCVMPCVAIDDSKYEVSTKMSNSLVYTSENSNGGELAELQVLSPYEAVKELDASIATLYRITLELEKDLEDGAVSEDLIVKYTKATDAVRKNHANVRHALDTTTRLFEELVSEGELSEDILTKHLKRVEDFESSSSVLLQAIEPHQPPETRTNALSTTELEDLKTVLEGVACSPEERSLSGLIQDSSYSTAPEPRLLRDKEQVVGTLDAALGASQDPSDYLAGNASSAIKELAADLNYDPVQIYYYVRNTTDYEPYFGLMAGSDWTLQQHAGNSFDQANLLVALLRESGIPARYVYGTIDVSEEDAANWLRVKDTRYVSRLIYETGIPGATVYNLTEDKFGIRLEHMWVEAYVTQNGSETWVPVDPSYKTYEYVPGVNLTYNATEVSAILTEMLATATYDEPHGWVTGVNETFITASFEAQVNDTIASIMADPELRNLTLRQLFGYWNLTEEYSDSLPTVLPYEVVSILNVSAEIPQDYYHRIELKGFVNYTLYAPEIASKKVMLKFNPATEYDRTILKQWGWKNAADWADMQPVLLIDGEPVANGSARALGSFADLTLEFYQPLNATPRTVNDTFTVGALYALLFNVGTVSLPQVESEINECDFAANETFADNVLRQLHLIGMCWFFESDYFEEIYAAAFDVRSYRSSPAYGRTALDLQVACVFGLCSVDEGGMVMDISRHTLGAVGAVNDTRAFMLGTGMAASGAEHSIFEHLYGIDSVSTVKVLQEANRQAIPVYLISQYNLAARRSELYMIPSYVWDWIEDAVNQDKIVIIPKREMQINGWTGIAYMVTDPETGASGFLITGHSGGMPTDSAWADFWDIDWDAFWKGFAYGAWSDAYDDSVSEQSRLLGAFLSNFVPFLTLIRDTPYYLYQVATGNNGMNLIRGVMEVIPFCGLTGKMINNIFNVYSWGIEGLLAELKGLPTQAAEDYVTTVKGLGKNHNVYPGSYDDLGVNTGDDAAELLGDLNNIEGIPGSDELTDQIANGESEAVFAAEIASQYKDEGQTIVEIKTSIGGIAAIIIIIQNPDSSYKVVVPFDINDWSAYASTQKQNELKQEISNIITACQAAYGSTVEIVFAFDGKVPQWVRDYVTSLGSTISLVETYGGASGGTLDVTGLFSTLAFTGDAPVHNTSSYSSIQEAVNAAQLGDTIYVHNGTYREHVVVNKPLALIGENKHTTIIEGNGSGEVIRVIADDCVISGFTVINGSTGIYVASDNNRVNETIIAHITGAPGNESLFNLTRTGGLGTGIHVYKGVNNLLSINTISTVSGGVGGSLDDWLSTDGNGGKGIGVYLHLSPNTTVCNSTISGITGGTGGGDYGDDGTGDGVLLRSSNNSIITDNTITSNNQHGLVSEQTFNLTISDNVISDNGAGGTYGHGIYLKSGANATVANNTIQNNTATGYSCGIEAASFSNATIYDNRITDNKNHGILLRSSSGLNITGNLLANNTGTGINLEESWSNNLTNNTISSNKGYGAYLDSSSNNKLHDNKLQENTYNFGIAGSPDSDFYQDIDTSNTINSRPMYHLMGKSDIIIDKNAGYVALLSCNNITAKDIIITNNFLGIVVINSTNIRLTNNTFLNNEHGGIYLGESSNNQVTANTVASNGYGIWISGSWNKLSHNNSIAGNTVHSNRGYTTGYGIYLDYVESSMIMSNRISNNFYYGIYLSSASDNTIYNNYFDNTRNARDFSTNRWNITPRAGTNILGGPYLGGNYWSDYTGEDQDDDLLGDTLVPYTCSGRIWDSGDYQPLVLPYTYADVGVTVDIEPASPGDLEPELPPGTDLSNVIAITVNVLDSTPANSADDAYTDITINVGTMDIGTCKVFKAGMGFLPEVADVTALPTVKPPGEPAFSRDVANKTVTVRLYVGDPLLVVLQPVELPGFNTGEGTYPSIPGTHNGSITPLQTINVSTLYTYPSSGTGGHTEYVKLWNNSGWNVTATWNGYRGDWHNITFNEPFTLLANETYNYTIRTGSYPRIHHKSELLTPKGWITCTEFVDANGKRYNNRIPAIALY